jgi:ATP-binding cassette subfamily B protein
MTHFLRTLVRDYLARYWRTCLLELLCIGAIVAFDTLFPLGTKFLIDLAIVPRDGRMLVWLIAGLAGLYVVSSLATLASDYLVARTSARVLNDMRLRMFTRLQRLPASAHFGLDSGDVLTRFSSDLGAIENALTLSAQPGVQYLLQLGIGVVVLFLLDVKLAALTVVLLPLTAILPKRLAESAAALNTKRRAQEAGVMGAVQENLQAQAVTRAFGLRGFVVDAFARRLKGVAAIVTRSVFTGWMVSWATNIGQYLIQLLVIAFGAWLALRGELSVGSLVGFAALLTSLAYAVSLVAYAHAGLIPAVASFQRIEDLLGREVEATDPPGAPAATLRRGMRLEGVSFSYAGPDGAPNLDRVDLSIGSGQSVALVGRSGSGKSTVLNLLMRSHDPHRGRVLCDDRDLREVSLASLRAQTGVVFQDTFLFNVSLRENIRMGALDASDAEVEQAARAAGVHDAIVGLPAGYDTVPGEQGKLLSGGQRQRIALARAILRRPALLLLDEATSALDPETEGQIFDTLRQLRGSCTIVLVTHRLAPIADMDQIIVMDQGRVAEAGTHDELCRAQGPYSQLLAQQSGFSVSPDGLHAALTPARLRAIPLFEHLGEHALERLASQFVTERHEPGQTVIEEGEPGNRFYIIVRGKVAVFSTGPDGTPLPLGRKQDGDYFGEIALLEGARRTATVRTVEPSLFLTLGRRHFLDMMALYPDIRAEVKQVAMDRLEHDREAGKHPEPAAPGGSR